MLEVCIRILRITNKMCGFARALSLLFQLFYKIIPAIYSRALKLVCRISRVFWQAAASHYILCIIIMTIMRVYDRSAATGMFHTLSRWYFPHSNLGLANVLPCRASREFPTSVTFSLRYINFAKTN